MNTIDELREHLARSRLAVFYGPDLAAALTGLPDRAELAAGLVQRHGLPAGLSLAAAAQRVAHGGNRWSFTDFLRRQLDTFGKQPQRVHQLLAQLPVPTIIATAYDNLLERALQQAGVPFNKLVRDSDLAFAERRRRMLIKLYGDLEQQDTLVITEDDHYGLWRSREKESLLEKVRETLRDNAVLFVGYHMADPDFLLLWREMLDRAGRFAIGAYALSQGMPPSEQLMWQGRHVRVLDMEPLDCLERLAVAQPESSTSIGGTSIGGNVGTFQRIDISGGTVGSIVGSQTIHGPSQPAASASQEEIDQQQERLKIHRQTLASYLLRLAQLGSAHAPPEIDHGIREAREGIRRCKATLRGWGVPVENHSDDGPEPSGSSTQAPATQGVPSPQPAVPARAPAGRARRCADLAASVEETLELIKQYDDQRRLADDPKARRRAERSIADLRTQLAAYEQERRELGCDGYS